jgi:hypothetical protein
MRRLLALTCIGATAALALVPHVVLAKDSTRGPRLAVDGPVAAESPPGSGIWYSGFAGLFGPTQSGSYGPTPITFTNVGSSATGTLRVTTASGGVYAFSADTCSGSSLGPSQSCSIDISMPNYVYPNVHVGGIEIGSKKVGASVVLNAAPGAG